MLILSPRDVAEEVIRTLQREWETSQPEWVGRTSVRFLGMELTLHEAGYVANQANYIWDKGGTGMTRKVTAPVTKELNPLPEEDVTKEDVRKHRESWESFFGCPLERVQTSRSSSPSAVR